MNCDPISKMDALGFAVNWLVERLEAYSDEFERLATYREQKDLAKSFAEFTDEAIGIMTGRDARRGSGLESSVPALQTHRSTCAENISRVLFQSLNESGGRSPRVDQTVHPSRGENSGPDR